MGTRYELPVSIEPPCQCSLEQVYSVAIFENHKYRTFSVPSDYVPNNDMCFVSLRESSRYLSEELYHVAGVAYQTLYWEKNSKYCSACGALLKRMPVGGKYCSNCKVEVWPRISPAIIVLVRRSEPGEAEKILLVKAHNFNGDFHGLVAGFLEIGETLEECVVREVYEETNLKIKNMRYFGSQSWPYPSNIMIGFIADYDGGEIVVQETELKSAQWYTKDNLPKIPERLSIARKLIDYWVGLQTI